MTLSAIPDSLLLDLIKDGIQGDQRSFALKARKLTSKISKFDMELGNKISEVLSSNLTRNLEQNKPIPVDSDTRQELLMLSKPQDLKIEPIWANYIKENIKRISLERAKLHSLLEKGLLPTRSILMEGPPGVGKTLMATLLSKELGLPLLTLDLATVMSSYLGKTGSNIRAVLDYAKSFPCILFFDEFDAIAKKRDDDSDVGELKRLVTVLLQAIDEWPTTSLLVAATNHAELLDKAIWRRFDTVISFQLPDKEQISNFLISRDIHPDLAKYIANKVQHASFSSLEKKVNHAKKIAILEDKLFEESLCQQFDFDYKEYFLQDTHSRTDWIVHLAQSGLSQQKIAEEVGVSRSTVTRTLKKADV